MEATSPVNETTLKEANAFLCLECGKCTSTCVVARYNRSYSPRRLISQALAGGRLPTVQELSICLTCMACDARCPSGVRFVDLIRELRRATYGAEFVGNCSHGGALQSLMKLMTAAELNQDRLAWVTDDLKIADEGEVAFFVGCAPYFDAFFTELEVDTLAGVKGAVKVLNALGVEPVLLPDERCCGHDLLWGGDVEHFEKLARKNVELLRARGVKTVVFNCPECYYTFKADYPEVAASPPFEVKHLSEFLAERAGELDFDAGEGEKVTFQDPCRLARFAGVVEPPRQALAAAGVELAEMPRSGKGAVCCAGNGWLNCDRFSKEVQLERLREARATGATTLVTACPKCEIHFRCAMNDPKLGDEIKMEIRDFASAVASRLANNKSEEEGEPKDE
jgi:heterodisulfide reductase subunit D